MSQNESDNSGANRQPDRPFARDDFLKDLKKASRRLVEEPDRDEPDRPDERSQSDHGTSA